MWPQNYAPVAGSLPLSTLVAAVPIIVLLLLLAVARRPAWVASLAGLFAAAIVAGAVYGMPLDRLLASILYGAAFGLFPIGWVVFTAILLYRVSVESGKFEILKDSIAGLTSDQRLQALLIAFAFGAFIEGAAGFGTPVAVAGAMLAGLGFTPFYAAAICLLANTAPVAFGSIAIPITTLALTTGLPVDRLSAGVGRICAPVSLFVPAYLILVMSGWKGLRAVFPAAAVCGIAFAGTQFFVSNFVGPQLTDILASMAAMGALVVLIRFWRPEAASRNSKPAAEIFHAWMPYILLVIFVLAWGELQPQLNKTNLPIPWPLLHNTIQRMPPAVAKPAAYPAVYNFGWLSASGTACLIAAMLSAIVVGPEAASVRSSHWPNRSAASQSGAHACGRARTGVLDELLRRHRHTRPRLRRHRRNVPLLQRPARLARRLSHRQRHLRQRPIRHVAGSHSSQTFNESRPDGRRQLKRRSDGKNDQPDQHLRSRGRHKHEARRGRSALPLHSAPQYIPGLGNRSDRLVLHLCDAGLGAVISTSPAVANPAPSDGLGLSDSRWVNSFCKELRGHFALEVGLDLLPVRELGWVRRVVSFRPVHSDDLRQQCLRNRTSERRRGILLAPLLQPSENELRVQRSEAGVLSLEADGPGVAWAVKIHLWVLTEWVFGDAVVRIERGRDGWFLRSPNALRYLIYHKRHTAFEAAVQSGVLAERVHHRIRRNIAGQIDDNAIHPVGGAGATDFRARHCRVRRERRKQGSHNL